jgi:hypothetical protein
MKQFTLKSLFAVLSIIAMAALCQAEPIGTQHNVTPIVLNFAGAASGVGQFTTAVTRGAPQNTRLTAVFYGYSSAADLAIGGAVGQGTMKGTAVLYCGPAFTGPWAPVKDRYSNAASATANATFDIDGMCPFYTVGYTNSKSGAKISAYLLTTF